MKVGIRLPPCRPVGEMATAARRAETLGFDVVWFPDSQLLWRDVWSTVAAAAAATSTIRIGVAVTNVGTRHPSVLASAIRTVQECAAERLVVGFGAGDSALRPIGENPTAGATLRDGITQVRTLLRGDTVDFGGGPMRLRDACGPVPVYVAANGPRNLALAGAIADGVIVLSGASPVALARGLEHVRSNTRARPLEVVVSAFTMVTDDLERDACRLKPICAGIAQNGGHGLLALAGITIDVPARVPDVYPDLIHAEDWEHAVAVCDRWVSDADALAFAQTFSLFGAVGEIESRLRVLADAGATEVQLQHVGSYDVPYDLMDALGTTVLARR